MSSTKANEPMRNVSTGGEDIVLSPDKYYYVIDALYLGDIRSRTETLNKLMLDVELKEKVFPYTRTPFAKIKGTAAFRIRQITKIKYENINIGNEDCFSCDTGLIIIVAEIIFLQFVNKFSYDKLVDTLTGEFNVEYWNSVVSNFNIVDLALVLAPGVNSGYEFDGSGLYKIENL